MYNQHNIYFSGLILPSPRKGIGLIYHRDNIHEIQLKKQPIFIGSTKGHSVMFFHCNHCNYIGHSLIKRVKGLTYYVFGIFTCGIGFCSHLGMDTHHFCPSCSTCIGYSKMLI